MSRTITLPCEVGDTLYIVTKTQGIVAAKVRVFWIGKLVCQSTVRDLMIRTEYCDVPAETVGKTAFFTRKEAEEAVNNG